HRRRRAGAAAARPDAVRVHRGDAAREARERWRRGAPARDPSRRTDAARAPRRARGGLRGGAMPVRLHWFLPTNGDSHTDLSLGNAVGAHGARIDDAATNARKGDLAYMSQVARAAESLGFEAALT